MSNPSKKKGTTAETKVVKFLEARGLKAERKALAGSNDKGDIRLHLPGGGEVSLEVKAGMQTASYSRGQLDKWLDQAETEGRNAGVQAALIIVRYNHRLANAEVWFPPQYSACRGMMYLDEYARHVKGE